MQSRRQFLKKSCAACLSLSVLGVVLDACSTSQMIVRPALERNTFSIPLTQFETTPSVILRHKELPFDILVVKHGQQFSALQMRCTHNDVALSFSGKKLICSAHGSEFDLQGKVTKEPANAPLTMYTTSILNQQIIIHLNK